MTDKEKRDLERFNGCVTKRRGIGACWEFSSVGSNGYPVFKIDGKSVAGHRYAYEVVNGKIPPGMQVLHKCDNPACVRNDEGNSHLRIGTPAANSADMVAKRRNKGPRKPRRPLTDSEHALIIERFAKGETIYSISNALGRDYIHVRHIVRRHAEKKAAEKAAILDALHGLYETLDSFTKDKPQQNDTIATPPPRITPQRSDSTKIVILPANRGYELKSA